LALYVEQLALLREGIQDQDMEDISATSNSRQQQQQQQASENSSKAVNEPPA
jgi:hypothetical protein